MKKFKPKPRIDVPRWLETIIQCSLFIIVIFLVHFLGLDMFIKHADLFNLTDTKFYSILIIFFMYLSYKVVGTHTAVDLIEIDFESKKIIFVYWLFYFYKKTLTIRFEELSYKNKYHIFILQTRVSILIYQNEKFKIKLNSRNGWTDKQVEEVTLELLSIKPPLGELIERQRQDDAG